MRRMLIVLTVFVALAAWSGSTALADRPHHWHGWSGGQGWSGSFGFQFARPRYYYYSNPYYYQPYSYYYYQPYPYYYYGSPYGNYGYQPYGYYYHTW